jgi:hypothetical protein
MLARTSTIKDPDAKAFHGIKNNVRVESNCYP